jgi:hypothetical protein
MSTPPIPQMTVSQSGMLSRSPGAKNLPSRPIMMPAMITPMMSTGDPFHLLGTALFGGVAGVPVRPMAQSHMQPSTASGPENREPMSMERP